MKPAIPHIEHHNHLRFKALELNQQSAEHGVHCPQNRSEFRFMDPECSRSLQTIFVLKMS
jgi:hypothetical protein